MNIVGALKTKEQVGTFSSLLLERSRSTLYHDIWVIGLQFALRIEDLLSLKYEDVLGKENFKFVEAKTKRFTNKKPRVITINKTARNMIESRRLRYPTQEFLFQNEKTGRQITSRAVQSVFKRVSDQMDLIVPINTHSMRKTRGRMLWENETPIEVICKLLGHSDTKITLRYIGVDAEDIAECYSLEI